MWVESAVRPGNDVGRVEPAGVAVADQEPVAFDLDDDQGLAAVDLGNMPLSPLSSAFDGHHLIAGLVGRGFGLVSLAGENQEQGQEQRLPHDEPPFVTEMGSPRDIIVKIADRYGRGQARGTSPRQAWAWHRSETGTD